MRLIVILIVVLLAWPSFAMTFEIKRRQDGINVILARGDIVLGDAARLARVIYLADRDQLGNIPIHLDSPGGSVKAAFELVQVFDEAEVSAIVESGARCASSCATILFLSARFHLVTGTGLLGIHSCYYVDPLTRRHHTSTLCNELIAQNAVARGTSYGAVQMWQRRTPSHEMNWIGADVACQFGLCGPPGFDEIVAVPSYNCARARLRSDREICTDKRLARYEAAISKAYFRVRRALAPAERAKLLTSQRRHLRRRRACKGDNACILRLLRVRLDRLHGEYSSNSSPNLVR